MSHHAAAGSSATTATRTLPRSAGSRTVVLDGVQPARNEEEEETTVGVLQLRATRTTTAGRTRTPPRVTWTEDVVDNEGMGKKKTKICCIFHKQRRYDESSSSSSSSDSDSDSSDSGSGHGSDGGGARAGGRLRNQRRHNAHSHPHPHPHPHNNQNGVDGGQATRDGGGGSTTVHELSSGDDEYEPNAYERQPGKKGKKGKGKGKKVEKDGGGGGPAGGQGQPQP